MEPYQVFINGTLPKNTGAPFNLNITVILALLDGPTTLSSSTQVTLPDGTLWDCVVVKLSFFSNPAVNSDLQTEELTAGNFTPGAGSIGIMVYVEGQVNNTGPTLPVGPITVKSYGMSV